ncbi:MAG: 2-methylcitrate dehydratase [Rhodospirillaceae bacterium]|nr:2-methylcitrate dehydratase [Rhodospirillaceae bacterium]
MVKNLASIQPETQFTQPIALRFAKFAQSLHFEDIPASVRDRAKYLILDAVGIAFASRHYPFSGKILTGLLDAAGTGTASVIGFQEKLPLRDAVIMNGALIHGLDYDDTHLRSVVHPTASSLSTALGLSEQCGVDGSELLTTYVIAMESIIRIGMAAMGGLHKRGYHPTGVCAHFSSALAAGRLLGLDVKELASAQAFAGSTAAASMEFVEEGGWNKRLHPGWGGAAGITAAYLAKNGFVGPTWPYEGRYGLYKSHLHDDEEHVDYECLTAGLGDVWECLDTAVKPFPSCHFTHALADSALELKRSRSIELESIQKILVQMPEIAVNLIAEPSANKLKPASDYDAKFSAQFIVAACLHRGKFGLSELTDDVLSDEAILKLASKVEYEIDPQTGYPDYYSGGVIITTKDGIEHVHYERVNRGAGERALSEAEISSKFFDNALLEIPRDRAESIRDVVLELDKKPAREFASNLTSA